MSAALQRFRAATPQRVEIRGSSITYREFGDGPVLLFVHGWPLSGVTYRGLVDELADEYRCYVLDLPGAGDSPWNPAIGEMFRDFAAIVAGFMEKLDLRDVVLVGHDSGGTIARMAAAIEVGRSAAIMLTNTETPGHHLKTIEAFQKIARLPGCELVFKLLLRSKAFLHSSYGFGGCFADKSTIDGEFHETAVRPLQRDVSGALTQLRRSNLDIVDELDALHAKLDLPVLCVWGERDPFFPLDQVEQMQRNWNAPVSLEVVPGRKLLVHEDAAKVVAGHMRTFLRQHTQAFPRRATSA